MTNIQNFTVSIDWFQGYFTGKFDYEVGKTFQLAPQLYVKTLKTASRQFAHISEVLFEGRKIGIIQHQPYDNSVLHEDSIIFQLDNQLCYEKDFMYTIQRMYKAAKWTYKNITRLDVCTDGKGFLKPMEQLRKGKIEIVGRCDLTELTMIEKGKRVLKQVTIGSRSSEMFMKIYRKDKELEQSGKGYIKKFWFNNGVKEADVKGMERLEITFKNDRLKKLVSSETGEFMFNKDCFEDLLKLQDSEFLRLLIQSNTKQHYEFVKAKDALKNKTRAKRVFVLKLISKSVKLLEKINIIGKKSSAWARNLIKHNYMMYLKSANNFYLHCLKELEENFDLSVWREKRLDDWDYEYKICVRNDSGRTWQKVSKFMKEGAQLRIAPVKTW